MLCIDNIVSVALYSLYIYIYEYKNFYMFLACYICIFYLDNIMNKLFMYIQFVSWHFFLSPFPILDTLYLFHNTQISYKKYIMLHHNVVCKWIGLNIS